jgi:hypothetical protein
MKRIQSGLDNPKLDNPIACYVGGECQVRCTWHDLVDPNPELCAVELVVHFGSK